MAMTQGGWYDGRQYWDGKLGQPGVVMNPGESGFGQVVSNEVIAQTNPSNVAYIQQERVKANSPTPSAPSTPSMPSTSSTSSAPLDLSGMSATPAINLSALYQNLQRDSGISDLETQLSEKDRQFIEVKGELNDNPYLAEASRAGREATLTKLHDERTANLRNDIATKKADIETKLNLELKQLDLNSAQTKLAWDQFNTLLSAGALDSASGEDIAQITRATGIGSSMIQSAITARNKKEVSPYVVKSEADDGTVTVTIIDQNTGKTISQSNLGKIGNVQTGAKQTETEKKTELKSQMIQALESKKNSYGHIGPADWQGALASWISRGGDADEFVKNFKQYADPNRGDFDQVYYQR